APRTGAGTVRAMREGVLGGCRTGRPGPAHGLAAGCCDGWSARVVARSGDPVVGCGVDVQGVRPVC
ncbi:hypothetical protein, partial [Aquipuribacter hungaricus]|uniref:hypothetical protein n=1 Tax=Aquipuribacter hungaricus TaxID=545624 RepID=UPI0030EE76DE